MKLVLWNVIAFALITLATVVSYDRYQSGALQNEGIQTLWNSPD